MAEQQDMSGAKHTPGPWYVADVKASGQEVWINSDQPDASLRYTRWAGLAVAYGCDDMKDIGAEVAMANARRIVRCVNAHNELVQALRNLLSADETLGAALDDGLNVQGAIANLQGARDMARVALAKAGEQS